jgi:hypothetical protein
LRTLGRFYRIIPLLSQHRFECGNIQDVRSDLRNDFILSDNLGFFLFFFTRLRVWIMVVSLIFQWYSILMVGRGVLGCHWKTTDIFASIGNWHAISDIIVSSTPWHGQEGNTHTDGSSINMITDVTVILIRTSYSCI